MINCNLYHFENLYDSEQPNILLAGNGFNMNFGINTSYENIHKEIISMLDGLSPMPSDHLEFNKNIRGNIQNLEEMLNPQQDDREQRMVLEYFFRAIDTIIKIADYDLLQIAVWIKKFEKIFTINFDPMIYRGELSVNGFSGRYYFTDGFFGLQGAELEWDNSNAQDIFYLHGGFHIIRKGEKIIKLRADMVQTLSSKIQEYKNENPELKVECVFWPTSAKKVEDIESNPYIKYALDTLKDILGIVFLYGVSLDEKDKHIWDAIDNNPNITFVNISYCGNPCIKDSLKLRDVRNHRKFMDFVDKANQAFPNKSVCFFDSKSINIGPSLTMNNSIISGASNV